MATMNISEAESILDIVSDALQDTRHRHHPVSALKGYDIYQIGTAFKLRIANEFLILADSDDFNERFTEGLKLYDSIRWTIMGTFVSDDQVDELFAEGVFNPIDSATLTFKDERLAADETGSSFGDYCKSLGSKDPLYWQKIYTRADLEYTSASPRANEPVLAGDADMNEERASS